MEKQVDRTNDDRNDTRDLEEKKRKNWVKIRDDDRKMEWKIDRSKIQKKVDK